MPWIRCLPIPVDAEKPVLATVSATNTPIAWFILQSAGPQPFEGDLSTMQTFVENMVQPEIERVPGVAQSDIFGGRELEMQVTLDPDKLAARGITVAQLRSALSRENNNVSGGDFSEGKRRYVVRLVGKYESPQSVEDVVITVQNGVPVYVRDVASVSLGYAKPVANAFHEGTRAIAMNAIRETDANVLTVMEHLRETVDHLNNGVFAATRPWLGSSLR